MKRTSVILPVLVGLMFALFVPAFAAEDAAPARDLYVGARGADVTWLQHFLIEMGTGKAAISLKAAGATGYFGPLTRSALAEFQSARQITPAQGYFGSKTRAAVSTVSIHAPIFSGEIEAVDTGCFADGICSVTVDGKEVILLAGLRIDPPPVGSLKGVESIGDLESMIGATAHVYATTTTESDADYTLYGSTDYYVEVEPKVVGESITVRGTIGCLPPKDTSKPVIMMCAFGLKTEDKDTYYALRDDDNEITTLEGDVTVEITGTLVKGEHATWKSIGTIHVEEVEVVD
ncbi:MAG TPA: peptidoglycan-binding domain-containing protein [Candidatus Paceibacterota bacterium]|nr:peptidoglycan-binding domain-containing protein [Candidatus Paceibacterota bacterium]